MYWSQRLVPFLQRDSPEEFGLALGLVVAVLGFLVVGSFIPTMDARLDTLSFIQSTILEPEDFRPEATEQFLYLAALVYFLVVLFAWNQLSSRIPDLAGGVLIRRAMTWVFMVPGIWLLLPVSAYFSTPGTWDKSAYAVLGMTELWLPTWIDLVAVVGVLFVIYKLHSRRLVDVICVSLALLLALMTVFGENDPQAVSIHLQVLMSPLVQVMQGKTLLVDLSGQYGLFPQLLAPLFAVIGLSIESFTLVMSGFSLLTLLMLYVSMRRLVTSNMLLLTGYCSLLAFVCVWNRYMGLNETGLDPYFQYWPVRALFPSLAIFLIVQHAHNPTRFMLYLGHFLLSVGCLWNLDSGVPAWGAWVAYLSYRATDRLKFVQNALMSVGFLLMVIAGYCLYLFLKSGTWPSPAMMLDPHLVFTYAGYYMLPMTLFHPWNIAVVVYLAALSWSLGIWQGSRSRDGALVFSLVVLGSGLLSYYIGRSHDLVFPVTSYPAFFLVVIFLDRLTRAPAAVGPIAGSAGLLGMSLFMVLSVGLVGKIVTLSAVALERLAVLSTPRMARTTQVLDLVDAHSAGFETVLFLSDHATYWHTLTGKGPTAEDNLNVMFYQSEIEALGRTMNSGSSPVFVDGYFWMRGQGKMALVHQQLLHALDEAGYQPASYTEDRSFSYWSRVD